MRPTTTNLPAAGMFGWAGTARQSVPTMNALGSPPDRASAGAFSQPGGESLPGKGGGSTLQPTAGAVGGNTLAGLFMGNSPPFPGPQSATLPPIAQPRTPVVGMPPGRRPLPPTAPQQPAPLPRFSSLNELRGYAIQNPGRLTPEQINSWKRGLQRRDGGR